MTSIILYLAMAIIGAAAWRFRGGGIHPTGSTQAARLICGLAIAAPLAAIAAPLAAIGQSWWIMGLAFTLFIGVASIGWGDFHDMGTTKPAKSDETVSFLVRWLGPDSVAHDVAGMTICGIIAFLPTMAYLAWLGAGWAWMMFPSYSLGGIYAFTRYGLPDWVPLGPTERAEVLTGAALGACLLAAIVA